MVPSPFQRRIFFLFLGWPGMVLWLLGFLCFVFAVAATSVDFDVFWPDGAIHLGISAGISCIGFLMFNAGGLLAGSLSLSGRLPVQRLAVLIGYQSTALLLGGIALGCLPALLFSLVDGTFSLRLLLTILTATAGLIAASVFYRGHRKRWVVEMTEENA